MPTTEGATEDNEWGVTSQRDRRGMEGSGQELLPLERGVGLLFFLPNGLWSLLWKASPFINGSFYCSYSIPFLVLHVSRIRAWSQGIIPRTEGENHTAPRDPGLSSWYAKCMMLGCLLLGDGESVSCLGRKVCLSNQEGTVASGLHHSPSFLFLTNRNLSVFEEQVPSQKTIFLSVPSERGGHNIQS